jgi:hypothetical protein
LILPDNFCHISDLADGDVVEARFSVYSKDLAIAPSATGNSMTQTETYSFLLVDLDQLSTPKQRLLKRFAELHLPNEGIDWVVVCQHAIRFDADDAGGKE